jgi:hypothetical protein
MALQAYAGMDTPLLRIWFAYHVYMKSQQIEKTIYWHDFTNVIKFRGMHATFPV